MSAPAMFPSTHEGARPSVTPRRLFAHLDEDAWLWANTEGMRTRPGFASYLPGLPAESVQTRAAAVRGFAPVDRAMADYDAGRFCYAAGETNPDYGYACISERYARVRWGQHLDVLDYIADRAAGAQDIIVARRPEGA